VDQPGHTFLPKILTERVERLLQPVCTVIFHPVVDNIMARCAITVARRNCLRSRQPCELWLQNGVLARVRSCPPSLETIAEGEAHSYDMERRSSRSNVKHKARKYCKDEKIEGCPRVHEGRKVGSQSVGDVQEEATIRVGGLFVNIIRYHDGSFLQIVRSCHGCNRDHSYVSR
jgi:hypothetical protein